MLTFYAQLWSILFNVHNKSMKHMCSVAPGDCYAHNMELTVKGEDHMQMNTIKILLNFGQNNKQVNTLPPC